MNTNDDVTDMLGGTTEAASKPAAKAASKPAAKAAKPAAKAAKAAKPAAKPAAKAAKPAKAAPAKAAPAAKRPPMSLGEGERATLEADVVGHFKRSKKAINSRELATKLGTETRKLRLVLYKLSKKQAVRAVEAGSGRVTGMTVHPA